MPTKLNNSAAVATLTAICMMAGVARVDEGTDDPAAPAMTCQADTYAESSAASE